MKVFILLVLAVIYGSFALIILAAFAHDLLKRSRMRKRYVRPRHAHLEDRPLDQTWPAREDVEADAARGREQRPERPD